jgi:hypothetical protein
VRLIQRQWPVYLAHGSFGCPLTFRVAEGSQLPIRTLKVPVVTPRIVACQTGIAPAFSPPSRQQEIRHYERDCARHQNGEKEGLECRHRLPVFSRCVACHDRKLVLWFTSRLVLRVAAASSTSCGTFNSSTMIGMRMASTPSLNASSRFLPMRSEYQNRGVTVFPKCAGWRLCDGAIDTTTASGELILHVFTALAQFGRRLIQERTKAGLKAARARGRMGGRSGHCPRVEDAAVVGSQGAPYAGLRALAQFEQPLIKESALYFTLSLSAASGAMTLRAWDAALRTPHCSPVWSRQTSAGTAAFAAARKRPSATAA